MKCKLCLNRIKEPNIKKTGICLDCWYKPFSLTSVCREDLKNCFSNDDIAKFDDDDMASLASGMGEAYLQYFWIDLKIIGKSILENK